MIVICSSCSTKFNIPDARVAGKRARMKCKKCESPIEIDGTQLPSDGRPAARKTPRDRPAPSSAQRLATPTASTSGISTSWRVAEPSGARSTMTLDELASQYASGGFEPGTLVCEPGKTQWMPPYDYPSVMAKASPDPSRPRQDTFTDETVALSSAESEVLSRRSAPSHPDLSEKELNKPLLNRRPTSQPPARSWAQTGRPTGLSSSPPAAHHPSSQLSSTNHRAPRVQAHSSASQRSAASAHPDSGQRGLRQDSPSGAGSGHQEGSHSSSATGSLAALLMPPEADSRSAHKEDPDTRIHELRRRPRTSPPPVRPLGEPPRSSRPPPPHSQRVASGGASPAAPATAAAPTIAAAQLNSPHAAPFSATSQRPRAALTATSQPPLPPLTHNHPGATGSREIATQPSRNFTPPTRVTTSPERSALVEIPAGLAPARAVTPSTRPSHPPAYVAPPASSPPPLNATHPAAAGHTQSGPVSSLPARPVTGSFTSTRASSFPAHPVTSSSELRPSYPLQEESSPFLTALLGAAILLGLGLGLSVFQPTLFARGTEAVGTLLKKNTYGATSQTVNEGPAFDETAAGRALTRAAEAAQDCKTDGGPTGKGRVRVLYQNGGRATSAVVSPPFHETQVGRCLIEHFKATEVPAFGGQPVIVNKTFKLM